jgi:hypothetical protein
MKTPEPLAGSIRRRSGGGFVGGGFGAEGAAEGLLIATALNMLTTRTKIDTVLCIQGTYGEVFFHITTLTPEALRIRLSPAIIAVQTASGSMMPWRPSLSSST